MRVFFYFSLRNDPKSRTFIEKYLKIIKHELNCQSITHVTWHCALVRTSSLSDNLTRS